MLLQRTLSGNVNLNVEVPAGLPPAFADAGQLDSAIVNLALNARDAMPDGGTITLGVRECRLAPGRAAAGVPPGHYVVFSVADTGMGMAPEVAARAVEPFYSTKGGRGSGLGLSMVYGFVQQSGGGMAIESKSGAGTRVSLYLPVARETAARKTAPGLSVDVAAHEGRALIVEDDGEVRAIASAFVRSLGYDVVEVPDHDAAVARLARDDGAFDVVFSDLMLGAGPDGAALAAHVQQRWPDIGVVVTSGHAHGLGARLPYQVLPKPYDREQLAAAFARCRRPSEAT